MRDVSRLRGGTLTYPKPNLIEPLVLFLLISDVLPDGLLVSSTMETKYPLGPEALAHEALLLPPIHRSQMNGALALHEPRHLGYCVVRRYRQQRLIKQQLGYAKVRYRGLARNAARLTMLFALGNPWAGPGSASWRCSDRCACREPKRHHKACSRPANGAKPTPKSALQRHQAAQVGRMGSCRPSLSAATWGGLLGLEGVRGMSPLVFYEW